MKNLHYPNFTYHTDGTLTNERQTYELTERDKIYLNEYKRMYDELITLLPPTPTTYSEQVEFDEVERVVTKMADAITTMAKVGYDNTPHIKGICELLITTAKNQIIRLKRFEAKDIPPKCVLSHYRPPHFGRVIDPRTI